jgi:DNA-binding MarR family transcriptional regulator
MKQTFEKIADLDRMVHEPGRLAILTALSSCLSADFTYLTRLTGMTRGNLSTHLSKLENAGLISINKRFIGKKPSTMVQLTKLGRTAIEEHWEKLAKLRRDAQNWTADQKERKNKK